MALNRQVHEDGDKRTRNGTTGKLVMVGSRYPSGNSSEDAHYGPFAQPADVTRAGLSAAAMEAGLVARFFRRIYNNLREQVLDLLHEEPTADDERMIINALGSMTASMPGTFFQAKGVTGVPITIEPHRDVGDSARTFIFWSEEGTGAPLEGGCFQVPELRLRFRPPSGTLMMLDGRLLLHGTEALTAAAGSTRYRIGTALISSRATVLRAKAEAPAMRAGLKVNKGKVKDCLKDGERLFKEKPTQTIGTQTDL